MRLQRYKRIMPRDKMVFRKHQKVKKNKKIKDTDESPKKLKPFEGTKQIQSNKQEKAKQKKEKKDKVRKSVYSQYRQILNSGDEEAKKKLAITIEAKIKTIGSRPDPLTKTAKRKMNLLKRLKRYAEGDVSEPKEKVAAAAKPGNKKNAKAANKKGNAEKQEKVLKQKGPVKKPQIEIEEDEDSEEDSDDNNDEEVEDESGDESDDEGVDEEEDDDDDEDDDDVEGEEEEDDSDDESEEDNPPPIQEKSKKIKKTKEQSKQTQPDPKYNPADIEELQKNEIVGKNQNRYVLFVGNIPYDTNKEDLKQHFQKCGSIKHIRIPTEKKTLKPRGFGYVELEDAETYQKCMSMHHTFLKGRRINVLYTMGGKKKGEDKKKEIKSKNFKLHAMRKQGKLAGSKKETQKRSFRRNKQKQANSAPQND